MRENPTFQRARRGDGPDAVRAPAALLAKLLVALPALAASACTEDPGGAAEVTRTDSAGVEIVSVAGEPATSWRTADAPTLSIGRLEGEAAYQLYRVTDAATLSDGRIVVANAGSSELRFYDPGGRHLKSVGGEGDGPGEFRYVRDLDVAEGDSLYAWDFRTRRLSVFGPGGAFVRSFPLESPEGGGFPRYRGRFADGSFLVAVPEVSTEPPRDGTVRRGETAHRRYTPDGTPGDTVIRLLDPPTLMDVSSDRRQIAFFEIPFSPAGRWVVAGHRLHAGTGERWEVRTLEPSGRLLRILRRPVEPESVTEALFEASLRDQLARTDSEEWKNTIREAYAAMPRPDRMAVFDRLRVDAAGNLWVRRTALPDEEKHRWEVLGPRGDFLATATLPAGLRILEIGPDFVLGVRTDDLDVERVERYPIVEAGGPS